MRLLDHDDPIDPEIEAALDAIDATLTGEPVDARYAELAEIALLLSSDRPQPPPDFARSLDERVGRRFAAPAPAAPRRRRWRSDMWGVAGALAAGLAVALAIVVVVSIGHGGSSASSSSSASSGGATTATSAASSAARTPTTSSGGSAAGSAAGSAGGSVSAPPLQPPTTGRKVVQGAQLNLSAAPNRVDAVAQEVYDVMGAVNGIVENSSVTQGGPGGYANFQLSVPSSALGHTMTRLSALNYAQVVSRTDSSQDITDAYGAATRRLADARALRTSLLKQLAGATTTEQVDSLKAQIRDAEASISSDQATVNRLNHQVNYSQIEVTINARSAPVPVPHRGGGFTIGRAAHDAGRVLTVAAGVALIVLAALTPVALVVALGWWVGSAVKRRRREQALDSV